MDLARTSVAALTYRLIGMSFWLVVGAVTARALTLSDRGTYTSAVVVIGSVGTIGASFAAASGYFVSNRRRAAAEVMCNEFVLSLSSVMRANNQVDLELSTPALILSISGRYRPSSKKGTRFTSIPDLKLGH